MPIHDVAEFVPDRTQAELVADRTQTETAVTTTANAILMEAAAAQQQQQPASPERGPVSPARSLPPPPELGGAPLLPTSTGATAEEDEFTHSSSAVNSTEPASSYTPSTAGSQPGAGANTNSSSMAGQLARFLDATRKRMLTPQQQQQQHNEEDLIEDLDGMIISGYLQKLGRNGKWQTRWFESDGECLSYYKNENRTKLLATLDLEKVSCILVERN